jgi:hypothetical protein
MADLTKIKEAIANLSTKVDSHVTADAAAIKALQDQIAALQAQLASAGPSQEEVDAVAAEVDAITAKL